MAEECCGPSAVPTTPSTTGSTTSARRAPTPVWRIRELQLAVGSGVLLLAGWLAPESASTVLFVAGLVAGGSTFVPGALRGLLRGRLGVGLLMTIAAVGAVLLGALSEAAMLAFLFSVAEGLEGYAVARTRHSLGALLSLVPPTASVLRDGAVVQVPVEQLRLGELIRISPGERIATDGTVRTGLGSVDTSVVTGESVPVEVGPGSEVFAGTVNGTGALEVEVSATAEDNSLARLVHQVHQAQERKGATQRLAERFARPLVPGVLVLAALVGLVGSLLGDPSVWIERALVVLVAAAPCAFALSVPIAVVAAVGAASKGGVLIKGGAAVESLSRTRVVALDKTGTLTRNEPTVVDVITAGDTTREQVLQVAAALEARSEHPLAAAILDAARDLDHGPDAEGVQAVPGRGLRGLLGGRLAQLGKPGFISTTTDDGTDLSGRVTALQDAGASVVLVELDGRVLGAVGVRDEVRPEAAEAVARLRQGGVQVVMLTGDNERTAAAIAADAGIGDVRANLLPEDKARIVTELRAGGAVTMVGDGVNDAPALATAETGVAMGAMGTDVAIEAADVALMGEDLRRLPDALDHARAARRVFLQNLILSGAILVALVPLAATGVLGLTAVVATHELAEVLVILNGIRAGRRRHFPQHPALRPSRATRQVREHVFGTTSSTTPHSAIPAEHQHPDRLTGRPAASEGTGVRPSAQAGTAVQGASLPVLTAPGPRDGPGEEDGCSCCR